MRPEVLYLTDIVEAADAIQRFVGAREREDFLGDAFSAFEAHVGFRIAHRLGQEMLLAKGEASPDLD